MENSNCRPEAQQNLVQNSPIEKIMLRLVEDKKHLDQDIVYETLIKELPQKQVYEKIKRDFMPNIGESMIYKMGQELGKIYIPLLIEPAISTRFDDFITFAKSEIGDKNLLDPLELRKKFKESLGQTRVYRVAAFTKKELEDVKQNGFLSNYYRLHSLDSILKNEDTCEGMEYNYFNNLIGQVNIHEGFGITKDSMLISVSNYPQMAQYAAFVQLNKNWSQLETAGKKLYLIPIDIDEFRNIRYGKFLPKRHMNIKGFWHSDSEDIPYNDPGVESFIEFQIPSKNISISEIKEVNINQIPNFKFVSEKK